MSDRVLVIYEGEIVAEMPPESSEEDFGVMMTGGGRGTGRCVEHRRPTTSSRPTRPSRPGSRPTCARAASSRR